MKQCHFCTSNFAAVDYKNADMLRHFLSPQSKILPRRKTGTCMHHQRRLARAIKRARELAIVPYMSR